MPDASTPVETRPTPEIPLEPRERRLLARADRDRKAAAQSVALGVLFLLGLLLTGVAYLSFPHVSTLIVVAMVGGQAVLFLTNSWSVNARLMEVRSIELRTGAITASADDERCAGCRYDLRGIPADRACPECGLARTVRDIDMHRYEQKRAASVEDDRRRFLRSATFAVLTIAGGVLTLLLLTDEIGDARPDEIKPLPLIAIGIMIVAAALFNDARGAWARMQHGRSVRRRADQ